MSLCVHGVCVDCVCVGGTRVFRVCVDRTSTPHQAWHRVMPLLGKSCRKALLRLHSHGTELSLDEAAAAGPLPRPSPSASSRGGGGACGSPSASSAGARTPPSHRNYTAEQLADLEAADSVLQSLTRDTLVSLNAIVQFADEVAPPSEVPDAEFVSLCENIARASTRRR